MFAARWAELICFQVKSKVRIDTGEQLLSRSDILQDLIAMVEPSSLYRAGETLYFPQRLQ